MTRAGLAAAMIAAAAAWTGGAAVRVSAQTPWNTGYFPDVELTTQHGERVRFADLIKGRTVAIELIYTTCKYVCPLETARLAQVQTQLGDRMGRDVFFYSITIDPEYDTPAVLNAYAERYHAGPGWLFLTGRLADIDLLSKKLGLYAPPDPENKDGHVAMLLIGNETTGQWIRGSALDNPRVTANMIAGWVGGYPTAPATAVRSYAEARPFPKFSSGQYLFATRCSTCHSLGAEEKMGPNLATATRSRDKDWLARYLANPDEMIQNGDPLATALLKQYNDLRMPNLGLTRQEIADLLAYLEEAAAPAP
jgi:protein SCO1/2